MRASALNRADLAMLKGAGHRRALTEGLLRLPIDDVLPLEAFAEAFDRMRRNLHIGRIVPTAGQTRVGAGGVSASGR